MDEYYQLCETDYLKHDPKTFSLSLSLTSEKILTGCSFRHNQCADDCTEGLSGMKFKWVKPSKK